MRRDPAANCYCLSDNRIPRIFTRVHYLSLTDSVALHRSENVVIKSLEGT